MKRMCTAFATLCLLLTCVSAHAQSKSEGADRLYVLDCALFQPARTGHAQRVGVQAYRNHPLRRIRGSAFAPVLVSEGPQVQLRHHSAHKKHKWPEPNTSRTLGGSKYAWSGLYSKKIPIAPLSCAV